VSQGDKGRGSNPSNIAKTCTTSNVEDQKVALLDSLGGATFSSTRPKRWKFSFAGRPIRCALKPENRVEVLSTMPPTNLPNTAIPKSGGKQDLDATPTKVLDR
jgi:hypothetical protein